MKREEEAKARDLKEVEARLQRARTKRQLNERLKVRSVLPVFGVRSLPHSDRVSL